MNTEFLFRPLEESEQFHKLVQQIACPGARLALTNLTGAQKAHVAAALARHTGRPILVLCDSEKSANRALEDYAALLGEGVCPFPARELTFYQDVAASREATYRRIEALSRIEAGDIRAVVAPVDTLMHRLMPRKVFRQSVIRLSPGDRIALDVLSEKLIAAGYTREHMIEGKGQFSVRGEIVDIYPADASTALRLDFYDDELDTIRQLDVLSQRSSGEVEKVLIPPACEAPLNDQVDLPAAADRIREDMKKLLPESDASAQEGPTLADLPYEEDAVADSKASKPPADRRNTADRYRSTMGECIAHLTSGVASRLLEKVIHLLYPSTETILDYLGAPIVVLDEPELLFVRLESRASEFDHAFVAARERGEATPEQIHLLHTEEALKTLFLQSNLLCLCSMQRALAEMKLTASLDWDGTPIGSYGGKTRDLCRDVQAWQEKGWRVAILSGGSARGERMRQSFAEEGITAFFDATGARLLQPGECGIYPIALSGGFQTPEIGLAVFVESDVYGTKAGHSKRRNTRAGKLNAFTDLGVGDYVVHEDHGIGIYEGITRLTNDGTSRDYLMVRYHGQDKLYIPVDHFDRIQKYIGGGESAAPKLSHLGGKDWERQKTKARESVKALAFDLVALYAQRQHEEGYAFSKDTAWQNEFEENFSYDETPDQIQAVREIKEDMERPRPMDRLLCGDVGYGKTEVALRAAFKAVMDGKQVAILAPTTILVQQHYNTLKRRLEGFSVSVDAVSRFKTPKEHKDILRKAQSGELDIVVGTHRLLAKDVKFRQLGLLIVDEEQRFGVGHKETIKNLKHSVDVLTLSATPIPRTLHMSMVGIRDMSLLETPPQARFPVQTYVMEYQDSVIRDAIMREVNRGGQVFFLYNRVGSIERCYAELSRLVPGVRIAIAHGQMRDNVLEDVMLDFAQHKFDVLLCTTIIESGLDIPNANTLIIYDAERFGLGQLYQMRGRVGRSNRMAYAYFTVRPGKALSEIAQKRLDTIREFTEFGSGFRIAMRDLELRGAGNILGPQQSGHLAGIGYDLYCKLLDEAVAEASGVKPVANRDMETRMDIHVNAFLPQDYVTGEKQRLDVYKRIASITSAQMRDEVEEELVDRFGDEPSSVANLVSVAYLKAICGRFGIERVLQKPGSMDFLFAANAQLDGAKLFSAVMGLDKRFSLKNHPSAMLSLQDRSKTAEDLLRIGLRIMERLQARMQIDETTQP